MGTDDNPAAAPATAYSASTQELIQLVEANPQLKQLLQEAIAKGKELNPDKKTNPAQSLSEYFINDIPLDELDGQSLYNNSLQYFEPYRTWLKSFAKAWGQYLDSKESWNQAYYEIVAKEDTFGISKGWYEDASNWTTFNQFFARKLKDTSQRPIAQPDNAAIVVSPADCNTLHFAQNKSCCRYLLIDFD